jgi:hypothetical protein
MTVDDDDDDDVVGTLVDIIVRLPFFALIVAILSNDYCLTDDKHYI